MRGNGDEQLTILQIFIAEAVVFRTENQRDFSALCRRYDLRRDVTWWLAVSPIKPGPASRSDLQCAIRNGLSNSVIALCFAQYVAAVDCHGPGPEATRSCFSDDRQLVGPHIFHSARDGADVSRAAGAD